METISSPSSSQPAQQESGRRLHGAALICVITGLMLTLLLEALDQTVVGTALPKIVGSLQGFDRYMWMPCRMLCNGEVTKEGLVELK